MTRTPTAPVLPWWQIAVFALAVAAALGLLLRFGVGWPGQAGAVLLLLLGLLAVIRRRR